jgi:hypothetical protein
MSNRVNRAVAEPAFLACRSHFSASARKYSARVCMLATSPEKGSNCRQSGDAPGAPRAAESHQRLPGGQPLRLAAPGIWWMGFGMGSLD